MTNPTRLQSYHCPICRRFHSDQYSAERCCPAHYRVPAWSCEYCGQLHHEHDAAEACCAAIVGTGRERHLRLCNDRILVRPVSGYSSACWCDGLSDYVGSRLLVIGYDTVEIDDIWTVKRDAVLLVDGEAAGSWICVELDRAPERIGETRLIVDPRIQDRLTRTGIVGVVKSVGEDEINVREGARIILAPGSGYDLRIDRSYYAFRRWPDVVAEILDNEGIEMGVHHE